MLRRLRFSLNFAFKSLTELILFTIFRKKYRLRYHYSLSKIFQSGKKNKNYTAIAAIFQICSLPFQRKEVKNDKLMKNHDNNNNFFKNTRHKMYY